jgi:hypothetical protein
MQKCCQASQLNCFVKIELWYLFFYDCHNLLTGVNSSVVYPKNTVEKPGDSTSGVYPCSVTLFGRILTIVDMFTLSVHPEHFDPIQYPRSNWKGICEQKRVHVILLTFAD